MNKIVNISFIGFGNMAKALIQGLSTQQKYQIHAASPSLKPGITEQGLITHSSNMDAVKEANLVILAVKPHQMMDVLKEIKPALKPDCILISVASGLSLAWFNTHLDANQSLVRCMPNIAVAYNQGVIPLIGNNRLNHAQKTAVTEFFNPLGITTWLEKEEEIDIFTALSGSGPAYIFLFLEALSKAAEKLGLDPLRSDIFSLHTLAGALSFLEHTHLSPNEARAKVTSKNGTTAAAIAIFEKEQFEDTVAKAVQAAYLRAKELGS